MDPRTPDVPAGQYLCEVAEVRVGTTRAGDERWSLWLVVAAGEFKGRHAAWDSLVFSTRGRARARMVFSALGLRKKKNVEPADLKGRRALVEVRPAQYLTPEGEPVTRNEVPYDGYSVAGDSEEAR
jgi:hypothetical protein